MKIADEMGQVSEAVAALRSIGRVALFDRPVFLAMPRHLAFSHTVRPVMWTPVVAVMLSAICWGVLDCRVGLSSVTEHMETLAAGTSAKASSSSLSGG